MKQRKRSQWMTFFGVLLLLAVMVTAVFAHAAVMTKSVPANGEILAESPSEVIAWFVEELLSGESALVVYDSQGVQVDNGDGGVDLNDPDHASMIVTLPPLPDGSYTVQWHVALLDGDATDGAFAFAVGENAVANPVLISEPTSDDNSGEGAAGTGIIVAAAGVILLLIIGGLVIRNRQS